MVLEVINALAGRATIREEISAKVLYSEFCHPELVAHTCVRQAQDDKWGLLDFAKVSKKGLSSKQLLLAWPKP
jgi:hypothetical protein